MQRVWRGCAPAAPVQEGDTWVPVCSLLPPALGRGSRVVMSFHNNEEKWTRGCFITFSSAPMPRWGLESKRQLCFGGCERKSLSLVNPTWAIIPSGVQWLEVEISAGEEKEFFAPRASAWVCMWGHAYTSVSPYLIDIAVKLLSAVKAKERKSRRAGVCGVAAGPEWSPVLFL